MFHKESMEMPLTTKNLVRVIHARASREEGTYVHCRLSQRSKSCEKPWLQTFFRWFEQAAILDFTL